MAVDRDNDTVYLLVHTYGPDLIPMVIADTLLRLPLSGGPAELVFGWPHPDQPAPSEILDIAASNGRLFATRRSSVGTGFRHELIEITSGGEVSVIPTAFPGQLGRIAVNPDATFLIAEVQNSGTTLYRMAL
jgi:hypothetical protein